MARVRTDEDEHDPGVHPGHVGERDRRGAPPPCRRRGAPRRWSPSPRPAASSKTPIMATEPAEHAGGRPAGTGAPDRPARRARTTASVSTADADHEVGHDGEGVELRVDDDRRRCRASATIPADQTGRQPHEVTPRGAGAEGGDQERHHGGDRRPTTTTSRLENSMTGCRERGGVSRWRAQSASRGSPGRSRSGGRPPRRRCSGRPATARLTWATRRKARGPTWGRTGESYRCTRTGLS